MSGKGNCKVKSKSKSKKSTSTKKKVQQQKEVAVVESNHDSAQEPDITIKAEAIETPKQKVIKTNKKGVKRKTEELTPAQPDFTVQKSVVRSTQITQNFRPVSSRHGCLHLKEYKENNPYYLVNYESLCDLSMYWQENGMSTSHESTRNGHQKRRTSVSGCLSCKVADSLLLACLDCIFIGCWYNQKHARKHFHKTNHTFAAHLERLHIFCFKCDDFVYDFDFERAKILAEVRIAENSSNTREPCKKRARYVSWQPTPEEIDKIIKNSTPIPCSGLRGLFNMGATCFMNAMLQTFLTNPIVKTYFLSNKHNREICDNKGCMCCEIDNLVQEFHSGEKKPYPPCNFLHAMWLSSKELAGYAEQDAHEFFIAAISKMHKDSKEKYDGDLNSIDVKCECIMHKTFGGHFQTRVKCKNCNYVNITHEHSIEWQLHLSGNEVVSKKKNGHSKAAVGNINGNTKEYKNSLYDCLERCTAEEQLPEFICDDCHTKACSSKRISCKKLPPVLAFIVERFQNPTMKNEAEFEFPEEIDMARWTSRAQEVLVGGGSLKDFPEYKYKLISVVNHDGKINTGHYTAYCRSRGQWFQFDDNTVKLASVEEVLQSKRKAYLCFYMADTLEYEQP
ncbi:6227_t:CDS:1 [Acaulospora morrowiae]|uniref:Ubiquitin carboxyl-terminal hydrolase n=1 Tax=Acaulospora morrowiae TaxID=94023 RepID=A0A9N8W400_9GLOM|nr:6227_t:CDS:1 [Acaulospora morrowiae]